MIIEELIYLVKVKAEELAQGRKKIRDFANDAEKSIKSVETGTKRLGATTAKASKISQKGINDLTRGITSFGKESGKAFKSAQLGFAKFLGLSLGIEATRRMIVSTTHSLVALGNMSSVLGMSGKSLDAYHTQGDEYGASKGETSALQMRLVAAKNFQTNPVAGGHFDQGLGIFDSATHAGIYEAKTVEEMNTRIAAVFRKLNQAQANQYGAMLGMSPAQIAEYRDPDFERKHKDYESRSGATEEAQKRARQAQAAMSSLSESARAVEDAMLVAFGPGIAKELNDISDWIRDNGEGINEFFSGIASIVGNITTALGGTNKALKDMIALYTASKIAKLAKPLVANPAKTAAGGAVEAATAGGIGAIISGAAWAAALAYVTEPLVDRGLNKVFGKSNYFQSVRTASTWSDFGDAIVGQGGGHWEGDSWVDPRGQVQSSRRIDKPATEQPLSINGKIDENQLLNAIAYIESSNGKYTTSSAGAKGVYQLMPGTAHDLGLSDADMMNPVKERAAARKHIQQLLKRFHGDIYAALAAYNGGGGRINAWQNGRGAPITLETSQYAFKVMQSYAQLNKVASTYPQYLKDRIGDTTTNSTVVQNLNVYTNANTVNHLMKSAEDQMRRQSVNTSLNNGIY